MDNYIELPILTRGCGDDACSVNVMKGLLLIYDFLKMFTYPVIIHFLTQLKLRAWLYLRSKLVHSDPQSAGAASIRVRLPKRNIISIDNHY